MEIEKLFKNLILIDFLILILIVISSLYQSNDLIEINKNLDKGLIAEYQNFFRIISLVLFFLYLLTLNLLYRFISYGKYLYLFLVISGIILNFLKGASVYSSFGSVLDATGSIISGAILILLFYSPIRENFK